MPSFTRTAIKQAFLKLLNERPYSEITVKDIVAACGINRNSFYYHFQDMPALLEEMIKEECDRIIRTYPTLSSMEECLDVAIEFAQSNKRAVLHIYRSVDRDIYEQYLWRLCEYVVTTYLDAALAGRSIRESDRSVMIRYYKCELFGQIMEWTKDGMKEDIRGVFHRLCSLKKGHAEEMIRRSEQDAP